MDKSNKLKKKEYEFNLDDEDEDNTYGKIFHGYENAVNFTIKVLMKELEKLLDDILRVSNIVLTFKFS